MDVDVRIPHQEIVHDDLDDAADDHGEDGRLLLAVGLQDSVGQDHQADEDEGDAQHLKMGARRQGILPLGRQHQDHDGRGENTEADARRQGQNGDDAEGGEMIRSAPAWSCRARAAAANGIKLMVTGYTKEATMLGISMAMLYWPFRAAADSSDSRQGVLQLAHDDLGVDDVQDAHCGVAEGDGDANGQDLPDQMVLPEGTSRDCVRFRCFVKYPTKNSMETAVPAVTPRMAAAAPISRLMPMRSTYHASGRPIASFKSASSTWETAVGVMLPWPWV